MRRITILLLLTAAFVLAQAGDLPQTDDPAIVFEVASVKPAPPDNGTGMTTVQGGIDSKDPGQVTYRNISIMNLLGRAYGPHNSWQIVGPNWLDGERFDVIAKIPAGTTKEQFQVMMRNLLAERFGLKLHHETREFKSYDLVLAKGGPKLQPSTPADAQNATASTAPGANLDKDGFPILNHPGATTHFTTRADGVPVARMVVKAQPVSVLLPPLGSELKGKVADQTGLTGTYDFRLEYTPFVLQQAAAANAELETPSLVTAIGSLGLSVTDTKTPQDVLVIDHVEKVPSEN
jgi:uncharacterized protein (TIGR03435 family)